MIRLNQILFSLLIFFFTFYNSAFGENKITIYRPLEVKVTDGDSFRYGDERIRLFGIDAPELKQLCKDRLNKNYKCGEEAKKQLNKYMMLANKFLLNINCYYSERDKYKRILAECYIGGNEKKNYLFLINQRMVARGHAVAYLRYSEKYLYIQKFARQMKQGIWQGEFDMPEEWRKKNK